MGGRERERERRLESGVSDSVLPLSHTLKTHHQCILLPQVLGFGVSNSSPYFHMKIYLVGDFGNRTSWRSNANNFE